MLHVIVTMKYTAVILLLVFVSYGRCQGQTTPPNDDPFLDPRVERPCDVYDIPCIRSYFAKHGRCKPARGKVPEPFFQSKSTLYAPSINITGVQTNIFLRGLMGTVREFYINRATDRVVLAVEFKNLSINATSAYLIYHRTAKEPIIIKSSITELYSSVTVTTVIPGANDLRVDESWSHADIASIPTFTIGPEAAVSSDPSIPVRFARALTEVPTVVQESFLTRSPYYMAVFIKYVICDFGFPLNDH